MGCTFTTVSVARPAPTWRIVASIAFALAGSRFRIRWRCLTRHAASHHTGTDLFGAHVSRFAFGGRTNVVACASDTHFHVLCNMDREISLRVFRPGFSSVQFFKSRDESVNPVRIFLQFHLNPPGRRIIITSAGQRVVNEPRRVGPAQHAVCTKRRTCSRSEYATWQDRSLSVGDDVRIRILESDAVDAPTERSPTNPKQDIQAHKRYLRMMAKKNRLEDLD